ncbi:hypothetical protein [Cardinium endosymbiont of Sogatella furcifera]|uniref:hypothetical protein n=1 Tax=Cardinium endosymbiont of Sogatella furcifera TaxID=650378 RepID=UPI0013B44624|nr:hypothetical protein [Cardinium endosymbiont of Sogatella furcifera]
MICQMPLATSRLFTGALLLLMQKTSALNARQTIAPTKGSFLDRMRTRAFYITTLATMSHIIDLVDAIGWMVSARFIL